MTSYFSLREINNQLLVENAKLKNQLLNKDLVVGRKYIKHKDTTTKKTIYLKKLESLTLNINFIKII